MTINIKSPHTYLNATVVGTPTITDGVVSGFSTSSYLKLPEVFNPESNTWEMMFKLDTGTLASTYNAIVHSAISYGGLHTELANGVLKLYLSSNGTSWDIASGVAGLTVSANTVYWLRYKFDGTQYTVDYSTDGEVFVNTIMVSSSTTIVSNSYTWRLGVNSNTAYPWGGSIDLNESYIKINGEYWWRGVEVDYYKEIKRLYYSGSSLIKQVYKTDKTKYYKYVTEYEDWSLPNFTSYTADGITVSATSEYSGRAAWKALQSATQTSTTDCWEPNATTCTWTLKFPYQLRITKLTHITNMGSGSNYWTMQGQYVTGDGTVIGNVNDTAMNQTTVFNTDVVTDTLILKKTGGGAYAGIGRLRIEGKKQVITTTGVKEVPFTFPELTSEGSIGGDEFGVQALDDNVTGLINMFQPLVDGKVANGVYADISFDPLTEQFEVYSPIPFKVTELKIYYAVDDNGEYITFTPNESCTERSRDGSYTGYSYFSVTTAGDGYCLLSKDDYQLENQTGIGKYHKFSLRDNMFEGIKIGKIVISGCTEGPLTADDDYDYKELIPQLVYENNSIVFQQSTAGTYTFTVAEEAPYEITLVGGGGGGAFNSSGNSGSAAAGNSGSGLVVNANLKAGTYVLNVGAGGAWSGWLDANTWGGNGSQSSISKDGVVIATAGGGTGNHCWWRSGSERNSTVGAAPTYTDALGVRDVILNTQGNWGGLAATSSGGASVITGTTWGKGGNTRNRNAADNGNAGCIRIVRLEK